MKKDMSSQPKATFDSVVAKAPEGCQSEMLGMDAYLKALRPLKFKRTIDKSGVKVNYVSPDFGISYAINVSTANAYHHFGWYFLYDRNEKRWYRKADFLEDILCEMMKTDPPLAERIFHGFKLCTLCKSPTCGQITYRYKEKDWVTCYGRVYLGMNPGGFDDAKVFFERLNSRLARSES